MRSHLRSGAALIIVLLILLALMVLGLPFLFSQSSGLAGSRSFQAAQAAHIYRQSAENLGLAIAAYTNEGAWKQTTGTDLTAQIHTALYLYLKDSPLLQAALVYESANRLPIDAGKLPDVLKQPGAWNQSGENVRIGVTIADESGLLDANTLSPQDWKDLFAQPDITIPDWDDQQVVVAWPTNEGPDGDTTGELADAIVHRRLVKGRFTRLEQLLEPDPQTYRGNRPEFRKRLSRAEIERLRPYLSFHNPAPGRDGQVDLGSVVYTDVPPSANYLPPKVWMDIPGNLVADGQWVWAEDVPNGKLHEGVIRAQNYDNLWISYFPWDLRPAVDSAILWQAPPALNLHQMPPLIRTLPAYMHSDFPTDPILPIPLIPVTYYGAQIADPPPSTGFSNALPTGFLQPWYHSVANPPAPAAPIPPRARQPIDLRSGGSIRIEAAATVRNHLGDLMAQESRTVIMQAVPQETTLERRWLTQGQFEPLVAQRLTSQIVTWPNATARATDLVPNDIDPAIIPTPSIKAETGISFKPLATLATSATTHLAVTWRAPLGVGTNTKGADALKDTLGQDAIDDADITRPVTDPNIAPNDLLPDGVRIGPNKALAYKLTDPANGAFVYRSPPTVAPAPPNPDVDTTIGPRHVSFWFQPQTDWAGSPVITLMELRPSPSYVTAIAPDIDDSAVIVKNQTTGMITDCQNYLGVLYDSQQNMLVLVYTPPSIAIATSSAVASLLPGPLTWLIQNDSPKTAGVDERCLPDLLGTSLPLVVPRCDRTKMAAWSPTLLPNRIMTCYKLGRRLDSDGITPIPNTPERGRWYNLQIAMGDGRPGGMSIILDGNVGNDVGVMPATEYFNSRKASRLKGPWPGDHLTFPNLILTQTLAAIDKTVNDPVTAGLFVVPEITVEMPGFSSYNDDNYSGSANSILSPSMTLPPRGSVLIGDEYIRYEAIQDDMAAKHKAKLLRCWRGDRQDTYTFSPNGPLEQLPSTQNHAINDRVIADGMRFKLRGTNNLYQGGTSLEFDFLAGKALDQCGLTSTVAATGPVADIATTTFTFSGGTFGSAPDTGFALVQDSSLSDYIYWYKKSGTGSVVFSIPNIAPGNKRPAAFPFTNQLSINNSGSPRTTQIWLASMEVKNDNLLMDPLSFSGLPPVIDPVTATLYWNSNNLIQLLNTNNGACEWIQYTDIVKYNDGSKDRYFFIHKNGWKYDAINQFRTRGMERTLCIPDSNFDKNSTLVLPVITAFGGYGKLLATGDVVTLVPRTYNGTVISAALAIRYSTNDGYDGNPALPRFNDTVNGRFAFTQPLRLLGVSPNGEDYDIVMGSGLTTRRDLTPLGNLTASLPLAALPRLDAHIETATPARVIFGSPDTARGGIRNTTTLMAIDAPAAGPWDSSASRVRRVFDSSGASLPSIPATGALPCFIWVTGNVFSGPEPLSLMEIGGEVFACERLQDTDWPTMISALTALSTGPTGFPQLLRNGNATLTPAVYLTTFSGHFARLVGRGQLGSRPMAHVFSYSPNADQLTNTQATNFGNLDYGPECMTLPVGPVRYLGDSANLVANTWFTLLGNPENERWKGADLVNKSFNAPYGLVVEASPAAIYPWDVASEVIAVGNYDDRPDIRYYDPKTGLTSTAITNLNYGKRITPKWLRGLYNTDATKAWANQGALKPLVIGWWPRFPSSYPSLMDPTTKVAQPLTAQHLRCRFYPWIGFPMNLHGARFDNSPASLPEVLFNPLVAANNVLTENSGLPNSLPNLQMEVRAMAGSIDNVATVPGAIGDAGGSSYSDWSRIAPSLPSMTVGGWIPILDPFSWNTGGPDTAKPTKGVEVRVSFRYTGATSGDLTDIARAANRAPLISGFKLRAHAPVATLAVEDAR